MLYGYLKKMLDGCSARCWFHKFWENFWETEFVVEGNKFLSRVERHAFVDRLIKKYRVETDFDYYFSREAIDGLMTDCGKNWKERLPDFDIKPFIF